MMHARRYRRMAGDAWVGGIERERLCRPITLRGSVGGTSACKRFADTDDFVSSCV